MSDELLRRLRKVTSGEFDLVGEVGHGGMARVFLAQEIALERQVAIKVLSPVFSEYPEIVRRFQHEARTAGQLSHPNIVPVYAVYQGDGLSFFTMPFIGGSSLREILRGNERLELDEALGYVRQAAAGLAYAHDHGVVHRDVKPENMILEQSTGRLVLTDFGLAKALGTEPLTLPGDMIGTPHYMAPEQCEGEEEVNGRADQYSLALVAYELLVGEHPFACGGLRELLIKQLTEYPQPLHERLPEVPLHVSEALQRALSKDPDDRFSSVDGFARALTGEAEPRRVRNIRSEPAAESEEADAYTVWMRDSLLKLHRRRRLRQWTGRASLAAAASLVVYFGLTSFTNSVSGMPEAGDLSIQETSLLAGQRFVFDESDGLAPGMQSELVGPPSGTSTEVLVDVAGLAEGGEYVPGRSVGSVRIAGLVRPSLRATQQAPGESNDVMPTDNGSAAETPKTAAAELEGRSERRRARARTAVSSPQTLLEAYRNALRREDLDGLGKNVYGGQLPKQDREMLSMIFQNADDLEVEMSSGELRTEGTRASVDVEFPMRYVLTKTQRKQSFTLKLRMSFERRPDGWRVVAAERR